jgi:hypothetical protein
MLHYIAIVAKVWLGLSALAVVVWCALVTLYERSRDDDDATWLDAWPTELDVDREFESIVRHWA